MGHPKTWLEIIFFISCRMLQVFWRPNKQQSPDHVINGTILWQTCKKKLPKKVLVDFHEHCEGLGPVRDETMKPVELEFSSAGSPEKWHGIGDSEKGKTHHVWVPDVQLWGVYNQNMTSRCGWKFFFSKFEIWPFYIQEWFFQRLRKRSRLQKWTSYWNILKLFSKFGGQEISKWSSGHHNLYKLFFSIMIFPTYTFSSRMTTSFCILPSSPFSKKNYVHPKCSCFQPYSKKKTRTHCHVSSFHFLNPKKTKTTSETKKNTTHRIDSSACSSAFMKWLEVRGAKPPRLGGLVKDGQVLVHGTDHPCRG